MSSRYNTWYKQNKCSKINKLKLNAYKPNIIDINMNADDIFTIKNIAIEIVGHVKYIGLKNAKITK